MEIVLGVIGALGVIWAIITFPVRWWWNRRKPPPASREDVARLEQKVDRLAEFLDGLPQAKNPELRAAFEDARALQKEGYEAQSAHKHREAIACFTRALALAEDDSQRAALHLLRGNSYAYISQYKEAEGDYRETLELAESISPAEDAAQARAAALGNLGIVYTDRGELAKAEEHHKQSLEIHMEIGNRRGEAQELGNLGLVYYLRGDLNKAEKHHKRSAAIHRDLGNRLNEAQAISNLGNVYSQSGDLGKAEEHYKQALKINREIGNRLNEASDLGNLGLVYRQRGDLNKAEEHLKQALEIQKEIGDRLHEANQLGNLGLVYGQRGELDKAKEHFQQAQTIYKEIGAGGQGPDAVRRALEVMEELERGEEQHPEG